MTSRTVVTTVAVPGRPYGIAVDPSGQRVFVPSLNGNNVTVIDAASASIVATIPVPAGPQYVSVDAAGRVYISSGGAGVVTVIDSATLAIVDTIPVGPAVRGTTVLR